MIQFILLFNITSTLKNEHLAFCIWSVSLYFIEGSSGVHSMILYHLHAVYNIHILQLSVIQHSSITSHFQYSSSIAYNRY